MQALMHECNGTQKRFSPFAVLHMALFPKHPRRCLRSGHGVPPFLGGTDTWRLLSVLPTPHGEVQDDQGPHDPTTQSMAAGEAEGQRSAGSFDKIERKTFSPSMKMM